MNPNITSDTNTTRWPKDPINRYPPDLPTTNALQYTAELLYEFIKGSRATDPEEYQLEWCEANITNFSYSIKNAVLYYDWGRALNSTPIMREGVFRVADVFMGLTMLTY